MTLNVDQFVAIWSHLEPFRANRLYLGPLRAIALGRFCNHFKPFGAIWSNFAPLGGMLSNVDQSVAICSNLEYFEAIWRNLK